MGKLERLLNLTAALLETERPLRADELRRRIDGYPDNDASFRRAFERDKDDLREMGVPISLEAIPGSDPPVEGYRVHKSDYYLPDPGLDNDELAALHLAASAVRVEGLGGAAALRKLGGSVEGAGAETIVSVPTDPRLAVIFAAVAARRVITFDYRGERRDVEPWRLDFVRGRWYVTGFDRVRAGERHFRIDRIDGEVAAGEDAAFERAAGATGVRMQPWELGDEPPRQARLLVDADQAAWAVHTIGPAAAEHPDGSVELELTVTNEAAFRSFVCGFLDHAEVLAPPDLRDDLIDWLAAIAEPAPQP
ncbi:MAG: helix-turn-helix transcriptional regulator [Acidimicrobiales bacterium]